MEREASDDELMLRLQQGDSSALAPLYRRHRGVVNAVVRRQVVGLSSSDAEDLAHETFLELVKIAPRYRPGSSLKGWLCGIALKKAWRRTRGDWLRRQLLARFSREETSEDTAARVDTANLVNRRLSQLPPSMREVVVLCLVEGLDTSDAAAALGITVNTVWTRLHRAREKLRELEEADS